jgi:hypothetical protein
MQNLLIVLILGLLWNLRAGASYLGRAGGLTFEFDGKLPFDFLTLQLTGLGLGHWNKNRVCFPPQCEYGHGYGVFRSGVED